MIEMKKITFSFMAIFVLGMSLVLLGYSMSSKSASTFGKAEYTIKQYKEVKKYRKIKTTYRFDKPVLKGTSAAIKDINTSLEEEYKKSLDSKQTLESTAKEVSKYTDKWKYPLYSTYKCKGTYNKKGIVSFRFEREWYAGGVHNMYHYGLSYDLKTGRKLQLDDVVSGSKTQIKAKIWKQYKKSYPQCPLTRRGTLKKKLSDWYFYLKGDKVVISAGAYAPWGGNGETTVSLPGAY